MTDLDRTTVRESNVEVVGLFVTNRNLCVAVSQRTPYIAIEIPIADLFDLGTAHSPINRLRSAFLVGKSEVEGTEADHFAYRGRDRDWQLWIRTGDKPVPLKFTLVDRRQPTQPRYSVTLNWIERGEIADAEFTFTPSVEQRRIEILRISTVQRGN